MVLDRASYTLEITAAGDFLPELRMPDNEIDQLDRSKAGVPLGIVPAYDYSTEHVELRPGTSVFWISGYTTQIMNSSGELYGFYGIPDKLKAAPREPNLAVEWVASDIKQFIGNSEQNEDICMICFQRID